MNRSVITISGAVVLSVSSVRSQTIEDLGSTQVEALRRGVEWQTAPFSVTQIDKDVWADKMVRSTTDNLTSVPGVMVQKTANGHGSPFIRGFTGYRTLSLIDGVRYNNSVYRDGPNEYFSLIDIHGLDSMELLQGPASVLYGSDAIGGTLNLQTKETSFDDFEGNYSLGGLSYRFSSAERSHQGRVEWELGKGGEWGLRAGVTVKDFGDVKAAKIGRQKNTGYEERAIDLRFDYRISDQWRFTAVHQQLSQDDVWRTHSTIFGKSFAGSTVGTDLVRFKDQRRNLSYVKFSGLNLDGAVDRATLTMSLQSWDEDGVRTRSTGTGNQNFFDSQMLGVDLQLESDTTLGNYVYGFDAYFDRVDSGRTDFNADGTVDQVRVQGPVGDDSEFDQFGLYVQGEWEPAERYRLTAGSRLTHVRAKVGRYEDPLTGNAASYADSWTTLVNSVKLSYELDKKGEWFLWGGVSQSFRAPNIADVSRYGGSRSNEFEVAALGLEPEKFLSYEVGVKADTESYRASATYYYTRIDDLITSTPTGRTIRGLTEVSKQNSASGYVQGVELEGRYFVNDQWSVWGNITWLEGEADVFDTTRGSDTVREPLSRIMPTTVNAGVEWRRSDDEMWVGMDLQWADKADKLSSGDKADTQRIPPGGTPSYTRINFYSGYKINDTLIVRLGIDNLLNEAYRTHGSGNNASGFGVNLGVSSTF